MAVLVQDFENYGERMHRRSHGVQWVQVHPQLEEKWLYLGGKLLVHPGRQQCTPGDIFVLGGGGCGVKLRRFSTLPQQKFRLRL